LFHADRRTDITELIAAFRNFASAPKKTLVVRDGIFLPLSSYYYYYQNHMNWTEITNTSWWFFRTWFCWKHTDGKDGQIMQHAWLRWWNLH